MGWQWHQLDHMQIIYTSLQTDNHASTQPLIFTGWMPFLPPNQQRQSIESTDYIYYVLNFHECPTRPTWPMEIAPCPSLQSVWNCVNMLYTVFQKNWTTQAHGGNFVKS